MVIKNFLNPEGHQNHIRASLGEGLRLQPAQQACLEDGGRKLAGHRPIGAKPNLY